MADILENAVPDTLNGHARREELLNELDDLWGKYLDCADEYQNTSKQLSDALSNGFLTLAQANFNSTPRARYGQDYYDGRMQALRKVAIEPADESWIFEVVKEKRVPDNSEVASEVEDRIDAENNSPGENGDANKPIDPLRWFGILVPQALRLAQTSFIQAAEGPIPRLATISRQMRGLEVEISRLKKSLKKLG